MKQTFFVVIMLATITFTGCLGDQQPLYDEDTEEENNSETIEPVGETNMTSLENRIEELEDELATVQSQLENVTLRPFAFVQGGTHYAVHCIGDEIQNVHGIGYDPDGFITDYEWSSDVSGVYHNGPELISAGLTPGDHNITFRVKDNDGIWSLGYEGIHMFVQRLFCSDTLVIVQSPGSDGIWKLLAVVQEPSLPMNDVQWELIDTTGTIISEGLVGNINGFEPGDGHGVVFYDANSDWELSATDYFEIIPGEAGSDLETITSVNDYRFRLTYVPTEEVLSHEDIILQS